MFLTQSYDYSVEHRSGSRMKHVDALNRSCHVLVIDDNTFEVNLSLCQTKDSKIKPIRDELEKHQSNLYEMRKKEAMNFYFMYLKIWNTAQYINIMTKWDI